MKTFTTAARSLFAVLIMAFALAACDSTSALEDGVASEEDLELFAQELSTELALSSDQQAALSASVAQHGVDGAQDPGFLWRLAAELSSTLTDEQIDNLLNGDGARQALRDAFGDRQQGDRQMGDRQMGPSQNDRQGGGLGDFLTEDQKADLEAIREARRAELESLFEAIRAARESGDTAAAEAAHEAIRAIQAEVKAEVEAYLAANLTQEQQDAIAAAQAEREAARAERQAAERAVMIEVLGITDAQADEMLAAHEAFRDALQSVDRDGDVQTQIEALRTDLEAAVSATLNSDASFEIWQIHQALSHRARKHRKGGRGQGGPGGRQGGGIGGRPAGGGAGG
ncbi:MAG: hypothetical protein HKN29_11270 [Rhodothermales bacterium]|nr:hypothetical protein [Rhodothermales bacterium]